MSVPYKHCGDIVCQYKRNMRRFAFQCLYCGYTASAFRTFKMHLEAEHGNQLDDDQRNVEKDRAQQSNTLDNACKERSLTPSLPVKLEPEETDILLGDEPDPLAKLETASSTTDSEVSDEDGSEARAELKLNDEIYWYSYDSVTTLDSIDKVDEELAPTDTKHFWLRQHHPIMVAIIKKYKQARLLWDSSIPSYRNYQRRMAICKDIADELNAQFDLHLQCQDIRTYITKLRAAYSREQRRLLMLTVRPGRNPSCKPNWYYEALSFLKVSFKQRAKRGSQALTSGHSSLPVPQLSQAQNGMLIELYRRCQRTWDMQDLTCRLRYVRQEANDELLRLCRSELELDIDQEQLQRYIYRIRYAYTQEKTRQLQCERDNTTFLPICRYYKQIQFLDQHVGPFKCELCNVVLVGVDRFKVHRAQHDGSMPFSCPICQRGFSRSGNCTTHMRRHTQDYHVECDECGKRFATTSDKQVHMRNHTGDRPYCCDVCGQRFRTASFFDRHKRRHEKRRKAKCHICGKSFFEQTLLNDHIKAHLNVRDKVCEICQKAFTSAKYLRQHKEIHAEQKRYKCKICGKLFAQYAGLSGHMKSHGTTVRGAVALIDAVDDDSDGDGDGNGDKMV